MIYREAHILLEEIAEAALEGKRKEHMELLATVPLLIIDDLGMRKLGPTAGEELLEIIMLGRQTRAKRIRAKAKAEAQEKLNDEFEQGSFAEAHTLGQVPTSPAGERPAVQKPPGREVKEQ